MLRERIPFLLPQPPQGSASVSHIGMSKVRGSVQTAGFVCVKCPDVFPIVRIVLAQAELTTELSESCF